MVGFVRKGRGKEEVEVRQGRFGDVEGKILVIGEGRRWCVDRVSGGSSKGVEIEGCVGMIVGEREAKVRSNLQRGE